MVEEEWDFPIPQMAGRPLSVHVIFLFVVVILFYF